MYDITFYKKGVIMVTESRSTLQAAIKAAQEHATQLFGAMAGERVLFEAAYLRNDELRETGELLILL